MSETETEKMEKRIKQQVAEFPAKADAEKARNEQAVFDTAIKAEKDRQQAAQEKSDGERQKKALWPNYPHEE